MRLPPNKRQPPPEEKMAINAIFSEQVVQL
jgi:hypothetical protein